MPHTLLFSLSLIADEDDDISSPSPGFSTRSRKRLWFVAFSLLSFCQPFPFFRQLTTSQLPSLPSSHSKPNPVSFQLVARRRARFLQTDLDPSSLFPSQSTSKATPLPPTHQLLFLALPTFTILTPTVSYERSLSLVSHVSTFSLSRAQPKEAKRKKRGS